MAMFGFLKKKGGKSKEQVPSAPDAPPPAMQAPGSQGQQFPDMPSLDIPNIKLPDEQQPSPAGQPQMPPLQGGQPQDMNVGTYMPKGRAQPFPKDFADDIPDLPKFSDEDMSSPDTGGSGDDEDLFFQKPDAQEEESKPSNDVPPVKPVDFDNIKLKRDSDAGKEDDLLQEPDSGQDATTLPGFMDDSSGGGMQEPTPEPDQEPALKPVEEPAPETIEEPDAEEKEEPVPESMEEPVPEPVEEPAPEPSHEVSYFDGLNQEVEPPKDTEGGERPIREEIASAALSKRIINDSMFISLDDFREVVDLINNLGSESKMADETLLRVKDITISKEKVYDKWQDDMEEVEKELIQLDKLLFKL